MQVISVERWTFWTAVLVSVVGMVAQWLIGTIQLGGGFFIDPAEAGLGLGFVLFVVSAALGGSRDPTVRRIPPQASTGSTKPPVETSPR